MKATLFYGIGYEKNHDLNRLVSTFPPPEGADLAEYRDKLWADFMARMCSVESQKALTEVGCEVGAWKCKDGASNPFLAISEAVLRTEDLTFFEEATKDAPWDGTLAKACEAIGVHYCEPRWYLVMGF